jgi:hypothetical protein
MVGPTLIGNDGPNRNDRGPFFGNDSPNVLYPARWGLFVDRTNPRNGPVLRKHRSPGSFQLSFPSESEFSAKRVLTSTMTK